jgi:EmrB/QacA subfamily drug resistance transporter
MERLTIKSKAGRLVLLATIIASGMAFFDGSTTGVALPVIQSYFQATIIQVQWVVNAFALTLASLLLLSGSLGDKFGRKKIFSYGIILFIIGSTLSALSRNITLLTIFQALQGLGAAMMIPGSLSIISSSFEESVQGKVIGLWAGFSGGIAAAGPFLGGWLTQSFGWPSVWWINVPLGLIALFITLRFVPESKNPNAKKLGWLGSVLLAGGLFGISYGLMQGPSNGWMHFVTGGAIIGGLLLLILFVIEQMHSGEPLVPLKIFKSPLVTGANLVTLFVYFALSGVFFFLTLNLQQVQGYSPLRAGLAALPPIIIITFLSGPAGSLSDKIGPRLQMISGPALVALAMLLFMLPDEHARYFTTFFPAQVAFGLGMCLLIAPLTKSALSVPKEYSGAASGVNNAVSRIASMLAIAVLGAVMLTTFTNQLNKNLENSSLASSVKQEILNQKYKLTGIEIKDNIEAKQIVKVSFVKSFRIIMGINVALCVLAALIATLTIKNNRE